MIKALGYIFILAGVCLIAYGVIPSPQGYSAISLVFALCGAVCAGGGLAVIRFFNHSSKS